MKTTFITLILFLSISLNGQIKSIQSDQQVTVQESEEIKSFVNELVMETDSYIDKDQSKKKFEGVKFNYVLILPMYESFDVVKLQISKLLNSKKDIKILKAWTRDEGENDIFRLVININNHGVVVTYLSEILMVSDMGIIKK